MDTVVLAGVNLALVYGLGSDSGGDCVGPALRLAVPRAGHGASGEEAAVIHEASPLAIVVFLAVRRPHLGSELLFRTPLAVGSRAISRPAATFHWFVNGVAFAGDYLSAASFLGICGMIAFYGYDGFLYSIGYLAGWIVALFVIAEPLKRLGQYTFADALDSRFQSRGIKLSAGDQHAGRSACFI